MLAFVLGTVCLAQGSANPSFDVAEVHVRPHGTNPNPQMSGGVLRGGRFDLRNATMLNLIGFAYGVDEQTVLGGPNWLARDRFDIIAKAPADTSRETLQLMLQALLADRFKLAIHKDTRPIQSLVLTVSGTPKMKPGTEPTTPPCQAPPKPIQTSNGVPYTALTCHGETMGDFTQTLRAWDQNWATSRVLDETGLKGTWDFDLRWNNRGNLPRAGAEGFSLPAALEQQLGLKLTTDKVAGPVLVIEAVNERPTENASGLAAGLPAPPPAEFDVADIKLSAPDETFGGRLDSSGRLDFRGATMKFLVYTAWNIMDDETLAGAPKWFDTTKYSIVAKASSSAVGSAVGMPIDLDDVRLMLRTLLQDRFKLTTHVEDRSIEAYTLVVADKPKMSRADPSNRTTWFNGAAFGVKDPRDTNPVLNRLVTVQNMTMAQFAEEISAIAAGYLREPVVDATGLEGAYDFTLNFSALAVLQAAGRGADTGAGGPMAASDPNGALSIFDALPKQLGLKLEQHKRPLPVLVIDHIDEHPTDN